MIIEETFTVSAPREAVADFLLDIERVAQCVPGVQDVRPAADDAYEAVLRVQLGPIRASFEGSVEVDASAAPQRLVADGKGRDRSTGSQARVHFEAELTEDPSAASVTLVACRADVVLRGRLGQFGTGMITSTAQAMIRDFAACADRTLRDAGGPAPAGAPERDAGAAEATIASGTDAGQPLRVGSVLRRGLAGWLRDALARLRRALRPRRGR